MTTKPPGYEVKLHLALTQPILIAGLPRNIWLVWFFTSAALGFGAREFWVLPIAAVLYAGLALATRYDPYFFDVFKAALHNPKRLDP